MCSCGRYKSLSRFKVFFELQTAVFLHIVIIIHLFQDTVGLILQSALLLKSVLWEYCRLTDGRSKTQLILLQGRVGQQTRFFFLFPVHVYFLVPWAFAKLYVWVWAAGLHSRGVLASFQALWGQVLPCPASPSYFRFGAMTRKPSEMSAKLLHRYNNFSFAPADVVQPHHVCF